MRTLFLISVFLMATVRPELFAQDLDKLGLHILTLDPWVPQKEVTCIQSSFFENFRFGELTALQYIAPGSLTFPVEDFTNAVASCTGENLPGVVVHCGLDTNFAFSVSLEFICLQPYGGSPMNYTFVPATDHHVIRGGRLQSINRPAQTWVDREGQRYRDTVAIRDTTDQAFARFDPDNHVDSIIFPVSEINLLISHNNLSNSAHLNIVPTAEPVNRRTEQGRIIEENIHQGICWLGLGVPLNNDPATPGSEFKGKGADLGSPCPEDCPPMVRFVQKGIQGCKN